MSRLERELAELEKTDPAVAKAARRYESVRDVIRSLPAARPVWKFAGGKTQLLPELLRRVPALFGTYHEPFFGGGALFWALGSAGRISNAIVSDRNDLLIRTLRAVRDETDALVTRLSVLANDPVVFQRMREQTPAAMSDLETAVWFLYLNKTGFNGLFRVNKNGRFNVPFGRYPRPKICDEENLRTCARVLGRLGDDGSHAVRVLSQPFEDVLHVAKQGDLVYLDPPYPPVSKTANFVAYTEHGFSWADQERVRDVALELKSRGVFVILSNSDQPRVRELYADPRFTVEGVSAARAINSKGAGRGRVGELIIT